MFLSIMLEFSIHLMEYSKNFILERPYYWKSSCVRNHFYAKPSISNFRPVEMNVLSLIMI